ncbi:MAG: hypothetical protein HUU38_10345, partial [Anaerolineales bacterium]|nr:hypothetical protein [Anaerolineales bacterium]
QLAHYLEYTYPDHPPVEVLAFHYGHSENTAKQRKYFRKAGDAALKVSAFTTAVDYLKRLLEITPQEEAEYPSLALDLAETYHRMSDFANVHVAVERAYTTAHNDLHRITARTILAETLSTTGQHAEVHNILTEIMPLARATGDPQTLGRVLSAWGVSEWNLGNLDASRLAQEEALALARAMGDTTRELHVLFRLGTVNAALDNPDTATQLIQESYTKAKAVGNREREMAALTTLGAIADGWENTLEAKAYYHQALALARELGVQHYIALNQVNLATSYLTLGELPAARAELRQGLALALRNGSFIWVVAAVQIFAEIIYAEGDAERAFALLGLVSHHPAWSSMNQRHLKRTLEAWGIDQAGFETKSAKGIELNWDATIQELLEE